jgi:hypothetical protein
MNNDYKVYIYLKNGKEFITPRKGIAELRADENTNIHLLVNNKRILLTYD